MSLLIRNGRVITAGEDFMADIYVERDRVTAIGEHLEVGAAEVIDAGGCYVVPGGVDPHTHMDTPTPWDPPCDDFTSATRAAVKGGTTSAVDFCFQLPGERFTDVVARWHEKLRANPPLIDVGFHLVISDLDGGGDAADLSAIADGGVTSFKFFMAFKGGLMVDDEALFRGMQMVRDVGGLAMVHAENGDVVDVLVRQALADGHTEPRWHAVTRPPTTESEATGRAIALAGLAGAPLYVVHVSCRQAVEEIARAHDRGQDVWGETCTHYLLLDETVLEGPGFEGAKYIYSPPPRGPDDVRSLWRALRAGTLSVVSSDHCPSSWPEQKSEGYDDFSRIPAGVPGIEERLSLLYHAGVSSGRLSLNRWVELTSTAPARQFGVYPRKGTIAIGSDADLVVFDPDTSVTLSAGTLLSNVNYTLYEGMELRGVPAAVIVRGRTVVRDGDVVGDPGWGRFLPRERFRAATQTPRCDAAGSRPGLRAAPRSGAHMKPRSSDV